MVVCECRVGEGEGQWEDKAVDCNTDGNVRGVTKRSTKRARIHDFDASRQRNFEGRKNDCFTVV